MTQTCAHFRKVILFLIVGVVFFFTACKPRNFNNQSVSYSISQAAEDDLKMLDSIIQKSGANSLKEFLEKSESLTEYRDAVAKIYGDHFIGDGFDIIVADLKNALLQDHDGAFQSALWNKRGFRQYGVSPLTVKTEATASSVESQSAFENELEEFLLEVKKGALQSERWESNLAIEEKEKIVTAHLTPIAQKWNQRFAQIAAGKMSKKELKVANGLYFKELKQDPEANRAAKSLLDLALEDAHVGKRTLEEKNLTYDQMTAYLSSLCVNYAKELHLDFPGLSSVVENFSSVHWRDSHLSKYSSSSQVREFLFVPVDRPLHTLWKGIFNKECVGGGQGHRNSLTIERWATSALEDSVVYHVYQKTNPSAKPVFVGFVQGSSVKLENGKVYGSIDYGVSQLSVEGTSDWEDGTKRLGTVAEHFNHQLAGRAPFGWNGIVKSNSLAINNSGLASSMLKSSTYTSGSSIAVRKSGEGKFLASHTDATTSAFLVKLGHRRGHAADYSGNVITDGTVADVAELRLLKTDEVPVHTGLQKAGTTFAEISAKVQAAKNKYKILASSAKNTAEARKLVQGVDLEVCKSAYILEQTFRHRSYYSTSQFQKNDKTEAACLLALYESPFTLREINEVINRVRGGICNSKVWSVQDKAPAVANISNKSMPIVDAALFAILEDWTEKFKEAGDLSEFYQSNIQAIGYVVDALKSLRKDDPAAFNELQEIGAEVSQEMKKRSESIYGIGLSWFD